MNRFHPALRRALLPLFTVSVAVVGALAAGLPAWAGNTFVRDGMALRGHDPVAHFTSSQPMLGSKAGNEDHRDTTVVIASASHCGLFVAEPERFEKSENVFE